MLDKNHYARCLFSMPDASKLCQIWHTLCQVETTEAVKIDFGQLQPPKMNCLEITILKF